MFSKNGTLSFTITFSFFLLSSTNFLCHSPVFIHTVSVCSSYRPVLLLFKFSSMRCQLQQLCHKSALLVWPCYLGTLFFVHLLRLFKSSLALYLGASISTAFLFDGILDVFLFARLFFPSTPSNTVRKVTVALIVFRHQKCKCNCNYLFPEHASTNVIVFK